MLLSMRKYVNIRKFYWRKAIADKVVNLIIVKDVGQMSGDIGWESEISERKYPNNTFNMI